MTIFTGNDINVTFTQVVNNYLNHGYNLSPMTAGGSYSKEVSHIDLINPAFSTITRVWLLEGVADTDDMAFGLFRNTISIQVRVYCFDGELRSQTLWENKGMLSAEKTFYEIESGKCYTDDLPELRKIEQLRRDRCRSRRINQKDWYANINDLSSNFVASAMNKIRSVRGFKRATPESITSVSLYRESNRIKGIVKFTFQGMNNHFTLR